MVKTLNPQMVGISLPLTETLDLAARHGFSGVDLNLGPLFQQRQEFPAAAVKTLLAERGLSAEHASGLLPGRLGCADDEWAAGLEKLPDLAAYAAGIGFRRTTLVMLPFHDDLAFGGYFDLAVERLRRAADRLAAYGFRVGVEYVSQRTRRAVSDKPFIYSLDGTLALLRAVDRANVGILLDSFHWHCAGETRLDLQSLEPDQVVAAHLADAPDKPMADQVAIVRELPGEGVADLASYVAALKQIAYDGPLICEPFYKPFDQMPPDAVAARVSLAMDSVEKGASHVQ